MSLDLNKVVSQVGGMVARLRASGEERRQHLERALQVAGDEAIDLDALKEKIAASQGKTTWLVAGLVDGIARRYPAPGLPGEFDVLATDGSQIEVDRHRSTRCYLINIGAVSLHYGAVSRAALDSLPRLYADEADLVIRSTGATAREQLIEGPLLGIKRAVEECRHLAKLASEQPAGSSSLALLDGSLILWGLEAYPDFVSEVMLDKGYLSCFNDIRKLNDSRKLALASYISLPRGTDVVNALRVAICPRDVPDCDVFCPAGKRDCDAVGGVQDRELFSTLLGPGERSAVFASQSSVVRKHYGDHQVHFFYLRLDEEVARVEIPQWVAADETLLNLTHGLVLDQCRRGLGYPVALSEAHEQAVVTAADRENFWQLVESSLVDEHMPSFSSAKSFSKRTRWI
ncbi:MAG: DNA double-strand break repair nuclease NurA [Chloroflexota bacterium]|nr:DNA double-strand break repair nuclease NurA [Chloroflexota bacterium]